MKSCRSTQITFLQEGGTDDATMSFYASLGEEDPNNVTIAPPWPEESQAVDSPKSHSQRGESTDSGDSISGVIIMGGAPEADSTEVNSRTSRSPGEQTIEDKVAETAMAEGKERSVKQFERSQEPDSPKLVRMEEGKSRSVGHSVAGSESAGDMEATVKADNITPAASLKPHQPPLAAILEGDAAQSPKALAGATGEGEGSGQADPPEALDADARAAEAKAENKGSKADFDSHLDLQAPAGADSTGKAATAPDLSTAPKIPNISGAASESGVGAPSAAEDQTEVSLTHDDADASKVKSAEDDADIAAVDKVKAIMQAPYSPVGSPLKLPGKEAAIDAPLEDSTRGAVLDSDAHPPVVITSASKGFQEPGHSSGDQDAKVSVHLPEPPRRPNSARLENKGKCFPSALSMESYNFHSTYLGQQITNAAVLPEYLRRVSCRARSCLYSLTIHILAARILASKTIAIYRRG